MDRVCVFFASGVEEIEALTVVDLCRRAGIKIDMVSVTGEKTVISSHQIPIVTDLLLEEVDFQTVSMIVLPGGMPGTKNLEACEPLMEQVAFFDEGKKYISAICAAPSILGHRGMLKGRKACCYPDYEKELDGAEITRNSVEVSGHIITSRGMGTAMDFGLAIIERMISSEKAEEIRKKIVYGN